MSATSYALVLSAGRTGSTFLDALLKRTFPEVPIFTEAEPSRVVKPLHSLALLEIPGVSPIARNLAKGWIARSRRGWLSRAGGAPLLVEINPFLAAFGADLAALPVGPTVHMVRHPVSWVRSAISFGSYSWRRPLTRFMPLIRERPPLGHLHWGSWGNVERFAWRWSMRNTAIAELMQRRPPASRLLVRYEDLFAGGRVDIEVIGVVVRGLGLDELRISSTGIDGSIVNPSRTEKIITLSADEVRMIWTICGDLASEFGYKIADE